MKRIETILAAVTVLFALGACQKAPESTPAAPDSGGASAAAPQAPASAVPAPSEPAAPASAASR
ncbi:hypothetical protein GALL_314750 [mine drainage metagenome]|jgi:hypothetical protein|uniref:Lipoprotein n=1 Tax=mine drainage metagenome TaxID=410659 RepID=A0A1J5RAG1_9ZZZZ